MKPIKKPIWPICCIFLTVMVMAMILLAGCISPQPSPAHGITAQPVTSPTSEMADEDCTPITVNQSDDSQITLPCRPKRMVVTSPHVVEMLIAIGAADSIVGTTEFTLNETILRPKIPHAQSVGESGNLDMERVIALHPDILILPERYAKDTVIEKARAANITLLYLDCYRLSHHAADARTLGKLTGREKKAEAYAREIERTLLLVSSRIHSLSPEEYPGVYFESIQEYATSGSGSENDDLISMAGGRNLAGNISIASFTVNKEWVIAQNPEYILKMVYAQMYLPSSKPAVYDSILESVKKRNGLESVTAVNLNRVYIIDSNIKTGPRAFIDLVYLAKIFHPALFRDLDPKILLDDYSRDYVSGANETMIVYPDPL
jgi:iron complex transport system substrate-binding protein